MNKKYNYNYSNKSKEIIDSFAGGTLKEIIIPNGITDIKDDLFYGLELLEKVVLPNGITNIGQYAFNGCKKLTEINIPNTVVSIGYWAFSHCNSLEIINYEGTKDQWNKIELNPYWNNYQHINIQCTDGIINI